MLVNRNETKSHFGQNRNETELFWSVGMRPNHVFAPIGTRPNYFFGYRNETELFWSIGMRPNHVFAPIGTRPNYFLWSITNLHMNQSNLSYLCAIHIPGRKTQQNQRRRIPLDNILAMDGSLFNVLITLYGQGQARYHDLNYFGSYFWKQRCKMYVIFLNLNSVSFRFVIWSCSGVSK
jgi:hypothetical protein